MDRHPEGWTRVRMRTQADPYCNVEVSRSSNFNRASMGGRSTQVCYSTLFPVW